MNVTNLPADMWDRGFFFSLATNISQPARMVASLANQIQGHMPESANPAELQELENAAEQIEGAALILRRIVAEATAKPVFMIAAE